MRHQQREFVAAQPRRVRGRRQTAANAGGDAFQRQVAGGVAGKIVERLEVVEVDIKHRQRRPSRDVVGEQPVEGGAVAQTGQRVVAGGIGKLLVAQLLLGDVANRAEDLAGGTRGGYEAHQRFDMANLAVALDDAVLIGDDAVRSDRRPVGTFGGFLVVGVQIAVPEIGRHLVGVGDETEYVPSACVPIALAGGDVVVPDAGAAGGERQAEAYIDLLERGFGRLLLGDVGLHAHQPQRFSGRVALDDAAAIEHPDPVALLVLQPEFGLDGVGEAGNVAVAAGHCPLAIIGMGQLQPQVAGVGKFVFVVAQHPCPGRGVEAVAGRKIPVPDAKMGAFQGLGPERSIAIFPVLTRHLLFRSSPPPGNLQQNQRRKRYRDAARSLTNLPALRPEATPCRNRSPLSDASGGPVEPWPRGKTACARTAG